MRIAVTTIAKNEEQFVERWASSAVDADALIIGDTGSTDGTVDAARDAGIVVHQLTVVPWRFDVARNALLTLVPADIDVVITLDMDEVLAPGWRAALEKAEGRGNRFTYDYVWSWRDDGEPDIRFLGDRCHARNGYVWRHPCHETLYPVHEAEERTVHGGFAIHHHPDHTKPRSHYLDLLKLAVQESPNDARMAHYYARELYFHGDWAASRNEFMRHLKLPTATWRAERAQSMRYLAKMDYDPERWLWAAVAEDMSRRDALVDLVDLYVQLGRTVEAAGIAARALKILRNPGDYMTTAHAYDDGYLMGVVDSSRSAG